RDRARRRRHRRAPRRPEGDAAHVRPVRTLPRPRRLLEHPRPDRLSPERGTGGSTTFGPPATGPSGSYDRGSWTGGRRMVGCRPAGVVLGLCPTRGGVSPASHDRHVTARVTPNGPARTVTTPVGINADLVVAQARVADMSVKVSAIKRVYNLLVVELGDLDLQLLRITQDQRRTAIELANRKAILGERLRAAYSAGETSLLE